MFKNNKAAKNDQSKQSEAMQPKKEAPLATPNGQGGFDDGFDQSDIKIPRAKLMHGLSPEMQDPDIRKIIPTLAIGSIINSLTKELVGEEFIPIFPFKNYIRFNPKKKDDPNFDASLEPGVIIWSTNDHMDPRVAETKFGSNGEKPKAIAFMNFFCYFPGSLVPLVVSFSKTSYSAGKDLYSLTRFTGAPMYKCKYKLTFEMKTTDTNTYPIFKIQAAGQSSSEELKFAQNWWNMYSTKAKDMQVDHENEDDKDDVKRPY